jgi:hypothetical protein
MTAGACFSPAQRVPLSLPAACGGSGGSCCLPGQQFPVHSIQGLPCETVGVWGFCCGSSCCLQMVCCSLVAAGSISATQLTAAGSATPTDTAQHTRPARASECAAAAAAVEVVRPRAHLSHTTIPPPAASAAAPAAAHSPSLYPPRTTSPLHLQRPSSPPPSVLLPLLLLPLLLILPAFCRWQCSSSSSSSPACDATYEGHIDWVNDVLCYKDRIVTCSSDRAVKIWQADEEGE